MLIIKQGYFQFKNALVFLPLRMRYESSFQYARRFKNAKKGKSAFT